MIKIKMCEKQKLGYINIECEGANIEKNKIYFLKDKKIINVYPLNKITFIYIDEVKENENNNR